jgi:hypothetical protein
MMKVLILILVLVFELGAVDQTEVIGKWQSVSQVINNGTLTIEKEYLHLNTDKTFSIILLVSVQKGDAFIKDLQIKGSGIWKVSDHTLVVVVNKIEVPFAKKIYRISQASLRTLAANFKHKFENEPIQISTIKSIDKNNLITVNEALKETHYARQ